jgi:hypothetical protein
VQQGKAAKVSLNISGTEHAKVIVTMLGEDFAPLPGYTSADASPLGGAACRGHGSLLANLDTCHSKSFRE